MIKQNLFKIIIGGLIWVIFLASPPILLAQTAPVGELNISGVNTQPNAVMLNGENAISGRTVSSPVKIVTAQQAKATLRIPKVGLVLLAPASEINLSFNNSSISGDGLKGKITIETIGQTTLNFLMPDGSITSPNPGQPTVVEISFVDGRTQIHTVLGEVNFNNTKIPAGQVFDNRPDDVVKPTSRGSGNSTLLLLGLLGAAGVAVLLGVAVSGGGNSTPVSPTR